MKMTDWFQAELEAEAVRTRGALERVPEGKDELEAPRQIDAARPTRQAGGDDADVAGDDCGHGRAGHWRPAAGPPLSLTVAELLKSLDENVAKGREALANTSEDRFTETMAAIGFRAVVSEQPRLCRNTLTRFCIWRIIGDSSRSISG